MNCIFLVLSVILLFNHQTNGYSSEENIKGSINFTFDLYRTLYEQNENLVVSPYSFRILLGILYQSAYESTKTELKDKVYFGEETETLVIQTNSIDHLTTSQNMELANKLYLRHDVTVESNFTNIINKYKSDIELVDFNHGNEIAREMNQWIEDKTKGLIKNLVNAEMVDRDTTLFIINTLYFKAKWETPFSISQVRKSIFHGYDKQYNVDFMSETESFRWLRNDQYQVTVVELPYTAESNFVFWIVLPYEISNIQKTISKLDDKFIYKFDQSMQEQRIALTMPIFDIETSINGKKVLNEMGITSIFTKGQLNILQGDTPLKVSDVLQQTKITVNTEGTEAASSTVLRAYPLSLPQTVNVDRPFIYMIMAADTKEPIFIGNFVKQ